MFLHSSGLLMRLITEMGHDFHDLVVSYVWWTLNPTAVLTHSLFTPCCCFFSLLSVVPLAKERFWTIGSTPFAIPHIIFFYFRCPHFWPFFFSGVFLKLQTIRATRLFQDNSEQRLTQAKWAVTWQNQQNGRCAQRRLGSSKSDQSSLCAFWVAKDPKVSSCGQQRHWSDWANAQVDLSLLGAHAILLVLLCAGSNHIQFFTAHAPLVCKKIDGRILHARIYSLRKHLSTSLSWPLMKHEMPSSSYCTEFAKLWLKTMHYWWLTINQGANWMD